MPDKLQNAVAVLVANPFAVSARRWEAAVATLGERTEGRISRALAEPLDPEVLERMVLALAHVQACEHPDEGRLVLGERSLPRSLLEALPRSRQAYRRLALAAGRCRRALLALRGGSELMQRVRRQTWAACFGDALPHALALERVIVDHDVLLLGETGTGKELVAEAIQEATPGPEDGSRAPRSAVNAAAIPETLIESELFGHVHGAFTGATERRAGRIRSAHGGCFFLDEVGDLQLHTQVKLLRVMETNEVSPLGADRGVPVDVRYVAATHRDLDALVEEGAFRRDLLERLAGIVIRIPPLRDRPEDIVAIGAAFVERYVPEGNAAAIRVSRWLQDAPAMGYGWPGNVRELQNVIRNLLLGLPAGLGRQGLDRPVSSGVSSAATTPPAIAAAEASLSEVERWYVQAVMDKHEGNLSAASRALGIDRGTVRRKLADGS